MIVITVDNKYILKPNLSTYTLHIKISTKYNCTTAVFSYYLLLIMADDKYIICTIVQAFYSLHLYTKIQSTIHNRTVQVPRYKSKIFGNFSTKLFFFGTFFSAIQ